MTHTVSGEEGNGGTLGTSTAGTTNTVDIVLRVVGVVVVEHVSDVAHIFLRKVQLAKGSLVRYNHSVAIRGPFLSRAGLDASLLSAWNFFQENPGKGKRVHGVAV